MMGMEQRKAQGFSLVELLIAMAVGLVVMAGAVMLFRQGVDAMHTLTQRAEVQQNARVGINMMAQEFSLAGTGIPQGGIALPSGGAALAPLFACDQVVCYLASNEYTDDRLYAIIPGDGLGPTVNGVPTDIVTLAYDDTRLDLAQLPLVSVTEAGDQIEVDPATAPPIDDPAVGIQVGDVISICNTNGCAAGTVTNVPNNQFIDLADNDPLKFNQSAAASGNIVSILPPGPPPAPYVPETRAKRIFVITYFIEVLPGPDGVVGTADDPGPRLMRQVNAHPPVPVAENIENLQITYDIFDDTAAVVTANLDDANGLPNQIRKVSVSISSRSPLRGLFRRNFERITLTTSVSPRNLSFRDRYQ